MKRFRDPRWGLILVFLGILGSIPVVQSMLEVRQGEGVRALEIFSQPPTAANLRSYERSLEDVNWAARTTRPWVQYVQFAWLKDGGAKAVLGREGWYFYKPGLAYTLSRPEASKPGGRTNDPLAAIVDFRDQLASRGIQLVVMPVPNKETIYPDRVANRTASLTEVRAVRTRELLERLRAAKVEVIDLFEEFAAWRRQEGATSTNTLYLAQDTHWTPLGVEVAARLAARRLLELGWVRQGGSEFASREASIHRLGDIVRMLQVPMVEARVAPESILCRQVVDRETGKLYEDAPQAEILILGDSFLRVYQRDEPGSAGFVAHLARELRQPLLSLVNDGGGSTLVRQELRARPLFLREKKVVLWEFVERDIGLGLGGWKPVPLP